MLFQEWHSLSDANRSRLLALRASTTKVPVAARADPARGRKALRLEPHLARRLLAGALSWTFNWYDPKGESIWTTSLDATAHAR